MPIDTRCVFKQMFYSYLLLVRVVRGFELRERLRNPDINAAEQSFIDRNPNQRGRNTFRAGVQPEYAALIVAFFIILVNDVPVFYRYNRINSCFY